MIFKQFIAKDLGCASYLIGDSDAGVCVVVDPKWNVADYVQTAEKEKMRITHVIETHNHADHVSGHGKLAAMGVQVAIFEDAGVDYPYTPLKDGESIIVGKVRLTAIHTPGHRPEHIALAVSDLTRADEPWLVLTGDALFVGDVGRPDLAIEPEEGAAQLFHALHERILPLGDEVEMYPSHVAGSLCGKAMSAKESSTIGFERRWNPPLSETDEAGFVRHVTSELPPQPPQFARIVAKNRGAFITEELKAPPLSADEVDAMRRKGALVLDTRAPNLFGAGHVPGAINDYLGAGQFGTRASWVIPPETPVVLVLERDGDLVTALELLAMTGQDRIEGYLSGGMEAWDSSGRPLEITPQMSAQDLKARIEEGDRTLQVIDVRENSEWQAGHIPGAFHIPFHELASHLDEVPSNKPLATICRSGVRSSLAASILQAHGFQPTNVSGGMNAWKVANGPVVD